MNKNNNNNNNFKKRQLKQIKNTQITCTELKWIRLGLVKNGCSIVGDGDDDEEEAAAVLAVSWLLLLL